MHYKVFIQRRAEADILETFSFIAERGTSQAAVRWYEQIKVQISSLSKMPERCPVAPEAAKLGVVIRQLLDGKNANVYRIIFRILEEPAEVHVLSVRHGAREELQVEDIE